MLKYFALILFLLMIAGNIVFDINSRKRKKKERELEDRNPPVFHAEKNYFPIYDNYDIYVSDLLELDGLMQIQCSITQNGELLRGFCSKDLTSFEVDVRHRMREIFDQTGNEEHDGTIKMWYSNADGSSFSSTDDIPLKIAITFYKLPNINDNIKEMLKQCLYQYLQELVEVDWSEVNTILKDCHENGQNFMDALNDIRNSYDTNISYSARNVCRHLYMDMNLFYENQWFYGGGGSSSIYENLKTKYKKIEDCYLEKLEHEYARDTIF